MNLNLGDTRLIIEECKKQGLLRNQCAYVLATTYHETAHKMKPIREMGGESYLRKKKYYPYVGMGYVQLTWLTNYQRASKELGVDFVKEPRKLLEAKYAVPILVVGMKEGWFAGDKTGRHKLSRHITVAVSDFVQARRIINGTDKANLIAGYAKEYDALLLKEGYGVDVVKGTAPDVVLVDGPKENETQVVIVKTPQNEPTKVPAPSSKTGYMTFGAMLAAIFAAAAKYFGG